MTHEEFEKAASVWTDFDAKGVKAPEELVKKKVDEFLLSREKLKKIGSQMHVIRITPSRIDLLLSEFKKDGYSPRQSIA